MADGKHWAKINQPKNQPKDGNIKSLVLVKVCKERLKYDDKKEENEDEMPLR